MLTITQAQAIVAAAEARAERIGVPVNVAVLDVLKAHQIAAWSNRI